jgi:hypothetical protein
VPLGVRQAGQGAFLSFFWSHGDESEEKTRCAVLSAALAQAAAEHIAMQFGVEFRAEIVHQAVKLCKMLHERLSSWLRIKTASGPGKICARSY